MRYAFLAALVAAFATLGLAGPVAANDWVNAACGGEDAIEFENLYTTKRGGNVAVTAHARNIDCSGGVTVLRNGSPVGSISAPGGSVRLNSDTDDVISLVGVGQGDGFEAYARSSR